MNCFNEEDFMMTFKEELVSTFAKYGFSLNEKQTEQFEAYYKLLLLWNKQFNLTTITTQSNVIIKHFLDSVLIADKLKQDASLVDIGTGAGFPSIPLKIMRNDLHMCLVDSLKKRTIFLKEVVSTLQLEGVLVLHARAEDLANKPAYRGNYDYATARAVAKLNTLLEYAAPFLTIKGNVIAYKAKDVEEEVQEASNACKVLFMKYKETIHYYIEETESERNILFFEKQKKTPAEFPRQQNKAKRQPL